MAPGEIPASLLATDRGNASAVIARAQPPTALLSVRLALSFPITSRRSASARWSWGQVFATRLPTAALRPIEWGSPSWVAGPCSGWAFYFIGWLLLWVFVLHHASVRVISHRRRTFRVRCIASLCAWFRVHSCGRHGQFQSWRGDRIYCSRCARFRGSICEGPELLKSGSQCLCVAAMA